MNEELNKIIKEKNLDVNKLRLSIGSGNVRYSNCINMDLYKEYKDEKGENEVDVDIAGDITKRTPFDKETFKEVLMIHVIEHIERKFHARVFDEIWRILKPDGRLILGFPDFIENAKRFIENKYGGRWRLYHNCIYGRQGRPGDYHVTAIERQDITDRLLSAGFTNIKYLQHTINVTMTAYKGPKLKEFL